jgi:hypothetical protein
MKHPAHFIGELTYGEMYKQTAGESMQFTLEISWLGNRFSGISKDISGRGVSPDEATVNGHLSGDSISYTKQYKRRHFIGADLSTEIHEKPGFPILYKGNFNSDKNQYLSLNASHLNWRKGLTQNPSHLACLNFFKPIAMRL